MQDSFKKNYIYNLAYQIFAIIVPLITTPYVSRVLGASAIGDYAYTASVVSYFGIVAVLGTATYAQREVAYVQSNREDRSILFYEIFLLRAVLTFVMFIIYVISCIIPLGNLRILYLVQLCTVFSWAFDISWFFQGIERFKINVTRNACVKLVSVVLIFALVKDSEDLNLYVLIVCGTILLGNLSVWPFVSKYVDVDCIKKAKPLRHIKGTVELFIPSMALQLYAALDQTMLGKMIDNTQVGYYEQSQKVIRLASAVLAALSTVLLPRMSAIIGEGKLDEAKNFYRKTTAFLMMMIEPFVVGLFFIAPYLVPVFFGEGFIPCIGILQIESFIFITQGVSQIAGTMLIALKKQKEYTIAICLGSAFNILLNWFLIPNFMCNGAAFATVAAELMIEVIMLWALRKDFEFRPWIDAFLHYLIPTVIMLAVLLIVSRFVAEGLVALIVLLACGVISYGVGLLIIKDSIVMELMKKILCRK